MSMLPSPSATFEWFSGPWGAALRCVPLSACAEHGFTSRQLSLRGTPATDPALWTPVAAMAGGSVDRLVGVRQVHGRVVRVLRRGAVAAADVTDRPDADAIVSDEPGAILTVLVADCTPVLLADRAGSVCAAVHAGWRGTAAGIVGRAVGTMVALGARAADLVAAIGPAIGPCCYEVGEELVEAFATEGHGDTQRGRWFSRIVDPTTGRESLRLDVALANHDQLIAAGLDPAQVFGCGLCTKTHAEVFDSYRAAGKGAGRMTAAIRVGG